MLSNSECCQTDRGYYTVLLRQRLKSTKNGCVHMTVCSSLAYSRPHCHHALALDSVRWHCAHVQFCPPCSTIHHPVTEYKTFSVALLTMHTQPPSQFSIFSSSPSGVWLSQHVSCYNSSDSFLSCQPKPPVIYPSETRVGVCSAAVQLELELVALGQVQTDRKVVGRSGIHVGMR